MIKKIAPIMVIPKRQIGIMLSTFMKASIYTYNFLFKHIKKIQTFIDMSVDIVES